MSDFAFKLGFDVRGMKSTNNSALKTFGFSLTSSASAQFTVGEQVETLTFTLYAVEFHRKLYEPGHIVAEILIQSDVKKGSSIDLAFLEGALLRRPVYLCIGSTAIANNYFIHAFTPIFETKVWKYTENNTLCKGTHYDIYVKLDIFSRDKLLTLDRFSRAYLGKKLRGHIINDNLCEFALGFKDTTTATVADDKVKLNSLLRLGHLCVDNSELVQPYLVQYNESFYDFIRRVANRCGEPLYFEDGKLCIGLAGNDDLSAYTAATECGSPTRLIYSSVSGGSVDSSSKGGYARNSAHDTTSPSPSHYNDESKGRGKDGFPADAFSDKRFPYNSELAAEDHFILLYKKKFARRSEEKFLPNKAHLFFDPDPALAGVSILPEILNSTSLMELVTDFAFQLTINGVKCGIAKAVANSKGEDLIEPYQIENNDYATLFARVDSNSKHWLTMSYYEDIRKYQDEQERKRICVNMGTTFENRKLGEIITVPGAGSTEYVVEQIDIVSGTAWRRRYDLGGTAVSNPVDGDPSLCFQAIPLITDSATSERKFFPPALPGNPFRRANGPQPAFVTDADDPKRQGRVRIRFAWQPQISDASKDTLKTKKKNLNDAKDTEKSKRKELKEYAKDHEVSYTVDTDGEIKVKAEKSTSAAQDKYDGALKEYVSACSSLEDAKKEYHDALHKYEDNSSPWIRMVTPMATDTGGGMYFQPEVGDEVMVDFENGNIDHPFVTGALFSKNNPAPDVGKRVIVSRNGHTIRFVDPNDASLFMAGAYPGINLLKSYAIPLKFDVKGARPATGGIEMTDRCGLYRIMMSSHDRKVAISSPFGDVEIDALTGISLTAPNGNIKIVGQNVEITANNKLTLTSGENIKNGDFYKFDPLEAAKIAGKRAAKATYEPFLDLSLLRTLMEIVIRPVDGTLKIKSNRFLLLEANDGEATIRADQYEQASKYKSSVADNLNAAQANVAPKASAASTDIRSMIHFLDTVLPNVLDKYIYTFVEAFNAVAEAYAGAREADMYFTPVNGNNTYALNGIDKPSELFETLFHNLDPNHGNPVGDNAFLDTLYGSDNKQILFKPDTFIITTTQNRIREKVRSLSLKVLNLKRVAAQFDKTLFTTGIHIPSKCQNSAGNIENTLESVLKLTDPIGDGNAEAVLVTWVQRITDLNNRTGNPAYFDHKLHAHSFQNWKKIMVRRMAIKVIHDRINGSGFIFDHSGTNVVPFPESYTGWPQYVNAILIKEVVLPPAAAAPPPTQSQLVSVGFEDGYLDSANGFEDKYWKEWKVWADNAQGEIVFSNQKDISYHFNRNGVPEKYVAEFSGELDVLAKQLKEALSKL